MALRHSSRVFIAGTFTAFALASAPTVSFAQSSIGAGLIWTPRFEGAKDNRTLVAPIGRLHWGALTLEGASAKYRLLDTGAVQVGAFGAYRLGRDEDDHRNLAGLGDLDAAVDIGGYAQTRFGPISLEGRVGADVAGPGGFSATATASYLAQMTPRTLFIPAVRATWADDEYMRSVFGVSQSQALASGLSAYQPSGGLKDWGGSLTVMHSLSDRWTATGVIGRSRLTKEASRSPIISAAGDRDQSYAIVGVSYGF